MSASDQAGEFYAELIRASEDKITAIHAAYQHCENAQVLSKLTLHRYLCRRGCVLMTVIRLGEDILARTRDYKMSPGMNEKRSVPAAREVRALDRNKHWPGHTFEIEQMESWGPGFGFEASCRHGLHTLLAAEVLAAVEGVVPGHPGKPTLL